MPVPYDGIPCSALIQWGKGLILPQLNIPDFADSPREVLPPLRSGLVVEWREAGVGEGEGEGIGASM